MEVVGKAKRLFKFSFGKKFSYCIDKDAWEYEKKIAGKFLLVTNNNKLTKEENMRPFFHKTDNGLKAHVFLCVLTLLVEKLINQKIPDMTTREVITELKKIKLSKTKGYLIRTDLVNIQRKLLHKLQVEVPTKVIN